MRVIACISAYETTATSDDNNRDAVGKSRSSLTFLQLLAMPSADPISRK